MTARTPASPDAAYVRSVELHRRIEAFYSRVEDNGGYFFRDLMPANEVFRRHLPPGTRPGVRVDPVVCALAIKAATTKHAIALLCDAGDGDNALALTRVLMENAYVLEWLMRGEERLDRLEAYALFYSVVHERGVELATRFRKRFVAAGADPDLTSSPYHQAITKYVFGDTTSDRATWVFDRNTGTGRPRSVKNIFDELGKDDPAGGEFSFEHQLLYGNIGSGLVHSDPSSLSRTIQAIQHRATFVLKPMQIARGRTIALAISNVAMVLVLGSLNEYVGIGLDEDLAALKAEIQRDPDPADENEE